MAHIVCVFIVALTSVTLLANPSKELRNAANQKPQKTWTDTRSLRANMDLPLVKYKPDQDKTRTYPKKSHAFKANNEVIRNKINRDILAEGKQGWEAHDNPRHLFERGTDIETDLTKLKRAARLTNEPWSGYYYPISYGGVSARYGDEGYNEFVTSIADSDGKLNYEQAVTFYQQPAEFLKLFASDATTNPDLMHYSPAEKYDILVGDKDFSLTNHHKQLGRAYTSEDGTVANWMGLCHGWAVAAYAEARPVKTVELLSADGKTKIPFHYDDIRALVSLKWAQSQRNHDALFVGGRCNLKDSDDEIEKDEKTGKILNKQCLDTNPGTWHIIVANKIANQNKSFIMDITFDHEVWNQPVVAYHTSFYNPLTNAFGTVEESIVPIDDKFRQQDPFDHLRNNPKAKKIVGVQMYVFYLNETTPRGDDPHKDEYQSLKLEYDLELDENNRIVGGEWHKNAHPDFLWDIATDAKAHNIVDSALDKTKQAGTIFNSLVEDKRMRASWSAGLVRSTTISTWSVEADGSPLSAVVSALVKLSAAD